VNRCENCGSSLLANSENALCDPCWEQVDAPPEDRCPSTAAYGQAACVLPIGHFDEHQTWHDDDGNETREGVGILYAQWDDASADFYDDDPLELCSMCEQVVATEVFGAPVCASCLKGLELLSAELNAMEAADPGLLAKGDQVRAAERDLFGKPGEIDQPDSATEDGQNGSPTEFRGAQGSPEGDDGGWA
jgi:hypothetical protein